MELTKRLAAPLECQLLLQLLQSMVRLLGSVKVEQLFPKEQGHLGFQPIVFGFDGAEGLSEEGLVDFLLSMQ